MIDSLTTLEKSAKEIPSLQLLPLKETNPEKEQSTTPKSQVSPSSLQPIEGKKTLKKKTPPHLPLPPPQM
jgi:hypothetical protein